VNYLPIFADLTQRPVLVVGGGDVAARKIDLLLRAGAMVRVVARELSPQVAQWHDAAQISYLGSEFSAAQLDSVFWLLLQPAIAS